MSFNSQPKVQGTTLGWTYILYIIINGTQKVRFPQSSLHKFLFNPLFVLFFLTPLCIFLSELILNWKFLHEEVIQYKEIKKTLLLYSKYNGEEWLLLLLLLRCCSSRLSFVSAVEGDLAGELNGLNSWVVSPHKTINQRLLVAGLTASRAGDFSHCQLRRYWDVDFVHQHPRLLLAHPHAS